MAWIDGLGSHERAALVDAGRLAPGRFAGPPAPQPIPIPDFGDDDLYAERLQEWILDNNLDEWHPEACWYTIKATAQEIAAHLRDRTPACGYSGGPE